MLGGPSGPGIGRLTGLQLPSIRLDATDGAKVDCARLDGVTVIMCQPDFGCEIDGPADGLAHSAAPWSCDAQAAGFRDWYVRLRHAGVDRVAGLSLRKTDWQQTRRARLGLPFHCLSDAGLALTGALGLATCQARETLGLCRVTLITWNGEIREVIDPGAAPARDAATVFRVVSGHRVAPLL